MRDEPESDKIKSPREAAHLMRFAGLVLDLDAFTLARESGEAIPLTRGEFALLCFFVNHPGRVLSRDALLEAMAGRRFEPFDRSVDVLVGRLRRKIEANPKEPRLIVTVPGEGYRFDGLTKTFQSAPTGRPRTANQARVEPRNVVEGPTSRWATPSARPHGWNTLPRLVSRSWCFPSPTSAATRAKTISPTA